MWKIAVILTCLNGFCLAGPVGQKRNMPIVQERNEDLSATEKESNTNVAANEMMIMSTLSLPSNATSIRADITDGFSCENKTYGYYADVDNDCQIFHVCLPVTYADGKENTFRWSFICPEETIFSQDSFTCMRPDDMTITCEESYQYYELNRNFGMVDSNEDKETSNEAAAETSVTAEINEIVSETENEVKPVAQEEEEQVIGQSKPVNAIKPSRRKPAISYSKPRKPANSYPLRKMPQTADQSKAPETPIQQVSQDVSESIKPVEVEEIKPVVHKFSRRPVTSSIKQTSPDTNENIQPVKEEEIKPVLHKFSRRPVNVMTNSIKDKIQNTNTESVVPKRTDLFNQIRKRPNLFNKKPDEQPEEVKREDQAKVEVAQEQQNFSPLATDMSNSNTETQVADTEIEASESNHVFLKPEKANMVPQNVDTTNSMPAEHVQVLEAFEEIPAVISEFVETPNTVGEEEHDKPTFTISNEKSDNGEEPQIIEKALSAEEIETNEDAQQPPETQEGQIADDTQTIIKMPINEDGQTSVESQTAEEIQTADKFETVQELQADEERLQVPQSLKTSIEEIQNFDETKTVEAQTNSEAEESNTAEKTQFMEDHKASEEIQNSEEQQAAEENESVAEIPKMEESQITEEIKSDEEVSANEELKADDEVAVVEENSAADKSETDEEIMPEVLHNLRASAEEVQSSEINKEEQPIDENQVNEEVSEQNEASAQSVAETQEEELKATPIEEQVQNVEETQYVSEMQNVEYSKENNQIQAVEASLYPAEETLTVEEPQPVIHQIEESQVSEKSETIEDIKPVEAEKIELDSENIAEPVMLAEHSVESHNVADTQTIEQMESEKPAEAPESMPATEEMSQPPAIVQQMYDDMDKESVNRFKPVDPVMAQEAEQLIVDFINTLRKNDFTNETPGMQMEQHTDEAFAEQEADSSMAEVQDEEKNESNQGNEEVAAKFEAAEQLDETPAEIIDTQADNTEEKQDDVHEMEVSKQELSANNEEKEENNALNSLETQRVEHMEESQQSQESVAEAMNLPQDMYQIPVQVIADPVKEITHVEEQSHAKEIKSSEIIVNSEEKTLEEQSADMPMSGKKPLSIDDIVELVKERLDQMPKNEKETPMQLEQVLGQVQDDKTNEEEQQVSAAEEDEQQPNSQSIEEPVMPIYQRTVPAEQIDAVEQTEVSKQDSNEAVQSEASESVSEIKEKTNRSYKTKLDSRKRRFLFKADSS